MTEDYLFSIITPTFNSKNTIIRCIKFLQKNKSNFEHIIVDDCSTDETYTIIDKFIEKNISNNIVLLKNDINSGPGPTRNLALKSARGKYIIFCDADDYLYPGALDSIEKHLVQYGEPDLCIFGYRIDNGRQERTILPPSNTTLLVNKDRCKRDYILDKIVSSPWAKAIKKTLVNNERHQLYFPDLRRAQDGIFILDVFLKIKSCLYLTEPLYYFDKTGDSLTRKVFDKQEFQYLYESWIVFEEKLKENLLYKKELVARKLRFLCINYISRISISSKDNNYVIPNIIKTTIKETALHERYFSSCYLSWKEKVLITIFLFHPSLAIFFLNCRNRRRKN